MHGLRVVFGICLTTTLISGCVGGPRFLAQNERLVIRAQNFDAPKKPGIFDRIRGVFQKEEPPSVDPFEDAKVPEYEVIPVPVDPRISFPEENPAPKTQFPRAAPAPVAKKPTPRIDPIKESPRKVSPLEPTTPYVIRLTDTGGVDVKPHPLLEKRSLPAPKRERVKTPIRHRRPHPVAQRLPVKKIAFPPTVPVKRPRRAEPIPPAPEKLVSAPAPAPPRALPPIKRTRWPSKKVTPTPVTQASMIVDLDTLPATETGTAPVAPVRTYRPIPYWRFRPGPPVLDHPKLESVPNLLPVREVRSLPTRKPSSPRRSLIALRPVVKPQPAPFRIVSNAKIVESASPFPEVKSVPSLETTPGSVASPPAEQSSSPGQAEPADKTPAKGGLPWVLLPLVIGICFVAGGLLFSIWNPLTRRRRV